MDERAAQRTALFPSRPGLFGAGRRHHLYFLLILVGAVTLRVIHYQGPAAGDDLIYFDVLKKLLLGADVGETLTSSLHWGARTGLIFPDLLIMRTFGVSEWSAILYPMCMAMCTLALIYHGGVTLHSPAVGLLAAGLYAILPVAVHYAGLMYPDGPVVFFSALFLYLAYRIAVGGESRPGTCLLTGLVLGGAYYIRETSILLFVSVPVLFFFASEKKKFFKAMVLVGLGFAITVGLEMALFKVFADDAFARFKILTGKTQALTPGVHQFKPRYHGYFFDGIIALFGTYWIAPLLIPFTVGGALLGVVGRSFPSDPHTRTFTQLALVGLAVLLFFVYAPIISLSAPLDRDARYYIIVFPIICLVFAFILFRLHGGGGGWRVTAWGLGLVYAAGAAIALGSIVQVNALGIREIETFIRQENAARYIVPSQVESVLSLKNGLEFSDSRNIQAYSGPEELKRAADALSTKHDGKCFLFSIAWSPSQAEVIGRTLGSGPGKPRLRTILHTEPTVTCRLLRWVATTLPIPPALSRRVCRSVEIYVFEM